MENLREKAIRILEEKNIEDYSSFELKKLIHELNVYKVELEVQNEELREKEEQLLNSQNELLSFFINAPIGYIVTDDLFRILKYNNKAQEILHLVKRKSYYYIYTFIKDKSNSRNLLKWLEQASEDSFQVEIISTDNLTKYIELRKYKSYLEKEEINLISIIDITKEKKLENKLIEQKEEFESMFNYSNDGIAVLDLESNYLNVNNAYIKLTGFTKNELLKKKWLDFSSPEDKINSEKALLSTIEQGSISNFERTSILKDGKRVYINFSITLLPDKKRFLILIKDVTSLKLLEQQTRLASMGEMIGNIAHQWRQPLSVITSTASGLQLKNDFNNLNKKDFDNSLYSIIKQANYLSSTIDNFRNFIKDEKTYQLVSLKDLIEVVVTLTSASLSNNYISLILDINDEATIIGSKNELVEALVNIINNAKDVLKEVDNEDDRFIFIETKELNNKIEILIKDTGGGIKEELIDKVFEPYFTTKHENQGTGLGLSISHKIIRERQNGTLHIYNETFVYNKKQYTGACLSIIFDNNTLK